MATALTLQTGLTVTPTANASDATGNYVIAALTDEVVLRFANTSGSPITVTLDDPNSTSPENAQTALNPDVALSVPATTGVRYILLSGARLARFRDSTTGRINWTPSAATGLAVEVVGFQ